ncbi:MAG TPA: M20/M25/M40 family metallo-hydrolase, partial [bacterium]|nr:M20/M25/M40 family metallo-hydrolase [bacterium]
EEYAGYIKKLQDFGTRYADSPGFDYARDYIRSFFYWQNLDASEFAFPFAALSKFHYPAGAGYMYADSDQYTFKRGCDRGATWEGMSPNPAALRSFSFWLDGERGFVAGRHNALARTRDAGATWESVTFHQQADELCSVKALCFVTADTGWVAGEISLGGRYLRDFFKRTEDGGRRWVELSVPEGLRPSLMAFYDAAHGWLSGSGTTYYTDDGGVTLRRCAVPLGIRDLAAVGPGEAWATCGTSRLVRTRDGVTWVLEDPGVPGDYFHLEFPDTQHGFAAGTALIKTDDGGRNWRSVANAPPVPTFLAFADRDRGVLGSGDDFYRTDDGGRTFVKLKGDLGFAAENVIGERRGAETPEELVIIGGHFDSIAFSQGLYNAPGADDNASGTACAMAAARAFRNMSFKRTVRYVAFGAEERGLLGSKAYAEYCARNGEKIVAVLNADMVCYDEEAGSRDDFAIDYGQVQSGKWLLDYLQGVDRLYGNSLLHEEGHLSCDDRSFRDAGYDALGAIEGGKGAGGSSAYPYAHSSEDTLDKLHPELGVRFVRDYAAMLAHLAGVGDHLFERTPPPAATVPFSRPFAVYPNPYCYASTAGGVNFVGIKAPARVEIYDLAGRRVASAAVAAATDEFVWRPGGEALSPGVYLYRVEGREQEESGKIVISK